MKKDTTVFQVNGGLNRRSFLKLSGLLGLGLASPCIMPAIAEAVKFDRETYKVSKTRLAMGTFVSITLIHPSRDKAEEAMGQAFQEIERLTRSMSRFDGATAVSQLNSEGFLKDAPPEVAEVVVRAMAYYRLTHQAFDISVKPVVDLFREKFALGKDSHPTEKQLGQALDLVGSDKIVLKGSTIRFTRPGMGITLDGIAKGYIVDRASRILARHKIKNHLINAGGDIRAMGSRGDKKTWTVAIQDPKKKKQYPDIIRLTDAAVATSGNYEVYFDREKMFHHIIDPRTGLSPVLNTSVSVVAQTAMDADALSTSVFVMNSTHANRFIDSLKGCECLIIAKGGKTFKSSGWKSLAI
ncbi:MAG: FAD:protein FMN transferase [Desulfobacteraceae bacterium]|nr:MAG: FAD:protein FMN transferase [Desulfobacteraceae bacterium]